jgi:type IV pilus assembly protein PilN
MARINLLPWREERRERRKREFFTRLFIAGVAAVVLVLLWGFGTSLRIHNQDARNAYLKGQIRQLDSKIVEIKNLQKVKNRLLARKKIVDKLQSSRSQMVHLFDQMVKTIPAGARLTALDQKGSKLTLHGVAQSNATVAKYMRNIQASPWMGPAKLVRTRITGGASDTPYEFELVVTLGTPSNDDSDRPAAASSSGVAPASAATRATTVAAAKPAVARTAPSSRVASVSPVDPSSAAAVSTSAPAGSASPSPASSLTAGSPARVSAPATTAAPATHKPKRHAPPASSAPSEGSKS